MNEFAVSENHISLFMVQSAAMIVVGSDGDILWNFSTACAFNNNAWLSFVFHNFRLIFYYWLLVFIVSSTAARELFENLFIACLLYKGGISSQSRQRRVNNS